MMNHETTKTFSLFIVMDFSTFVSFYEKIEAENLQFMKWELIILIASRYQSDEMCRQWCERALKQGLAGIPILSDMPKQLVYSYILRGFARGNCHKQIRSVFNGSIWVNRGNLDISWDSGIMTLTDDDYQMILEDGALNGSVEACDVVVEFATAHNIQIKWSDVLGQATVGGYPDAFIAIKDHAIAAGHVWSVERMTNALLSAAYYGHAEIYRIANFCGARVEANKDIEIARKNGHDQLADEIELWRN